jgi:hypothetical protein
MSLINEALKRAKQAQEENPPALPPLEFRPEEPGQIQPRRATLLIVGITLVVVMILGMAGMLVWFVAQAKSALPVIARVADAPLAANPHTMPASAQPVSAPGQFEPSDPPNTNPVPVVTELVAAVPPPVLKLQGIFFSPNRPSVVVNGKTIYLGDRVNGFRLIAVSPVAATFVSGAETNVLSLSGQ